MAKNFRDADDGKISGVDHSVATRSPHAIPAHPEKFQLWVQYGLCGRGRLAREPPQSFHQHRAVHFAGSFPSGDENLHGGHCKGRRRGACSAGIPSTSLRAAPPAVETASRRLTLNDAQSMPVSCAGTASAKSGGRDALRTAGETPALPSASRRRRPRLARPHPPESPGLCIATGRACNKSRAGQAVAGAYPPRAPVPCA
jgi:hypothetical protein